MMPDMLLQSLRRWNRNVSGGGIATFGPVAGRSWHCGPRASAIEFPPVPIHLTPECNPESMRTMMIGMSP